MLATGKAVKVTVYFADGAKHHGVPVYSAVLDFLFKSGIAGATVLKGVAGFGAKHRLHSAHLLDISDRLPVLIKFIDSRESVDKVMPELVQMTGTGLIEMEEVNILVPPRE